MVNDTINATVPGSGTVPAVAPTWLPPFVRRLVVHTKPIEKFCPFRIPFCGFSPCLMPDRRISTEPFSKVFVEQLVKKDCWQLMSIAGTPFSISASEVQFFPLAFVKYKKPLPDSGMVKLKFKPTFTHFEQPSGEPVALAP